jgi:hypothetical protein
MRKPLRQRTTPEAVGPLACGLSTTEPTNLDTLLREAVVRLGAARSRTNRVRAPSSLEEMTEALPPMISSPWQQAAAEVRCSAELDGCYAMRTTVRSS